MVQFLKKKILNDPMQVELRKQNMTRYNKSDIGRKKSSITAKRVSKRDIEIRRQRKKDWHKNNPELSKKIVQKWIDAANESNRKMLSNDETRLKYINYRKTNSNLLHLFYDYNEIKVHGSYEFFVCFILDKMIEINEIKKWEYEPIILNI